MADLSTIARPYAKAAFELARQQNRLSEWGDALAVMAEGMSDSQIAGLLAHPALTKADLADVLLKAFGDKLDAEAQNLLRLLIENRRLSAIGFISQRYAELRAEAESQVAVEITSAADVPDAQRQKLTDAVRKRLDRNVVVQWRTDASLVGGAVIRAGDLVIDGSVRGELQKMQSAMAA